MTDEKSEQTPGGGNGANGAPPRETAGKGAKPGGEATAAGDEAASPAPSGWGKGELEALRAETAELKDKLLRTVAEMENLRRRTERDKAETAKYAISNFARDVLTIADNIARAIEHVPADAAAKDPALKSFLDGMQVTERELLNVMERHGIFRLDPHGERFDPNKHQAMFEVENADVAEGTIVQVVQAGYVIADRVLRPALVGVARGGPKPVRAEQAAGPADAPPQPANDDGPKAEPEPAGTPPKDKKKVGGKVDKSA